MQYAAMRAKIMQTKNPTIVNIIVAVKQKENVLRLWWTFE